MSSTVTTGSDPTEAILSTSSLNEKALCDYVLNVATGCKHGCRFCYVPSTPMIRTRGDMLEEEAGVKDGQREWGDYVLYRDHIPHELPDLLKNKRKWRHTERGCGVVGVSFGTDCFMDERAAEITAAVIETLAEHERHCRVLTRNPLLAAHYMDTFVDAGEYVTIGSSIPTLDTERLQSIEPNAPPVESRFMGLQKFVDAGVPVYVSMSPTYPGMTRREFGSLLCKISELDPSVVYHEPMNPRGSNFEMNVKAAQAAGLYDFVADLESIRSTDMWVDYAVKHFQVVQGVSRYLELPVHLWPDRQLINHTEGEVKQWLQDWRDRQSPEPFAGRTLPSSRPPLLPRV